MKVEKRDASKEKRIVTAMIVDDSFLARIATKWEKDICKGKWANIIGGLCVKYYQRYNKAPKKEIEGLVRSWSEKNRDENTVDMVDRFLRGLNDDYKGMVKESNTNLILDLASDYFDEVAADKLNTIVEGNLRQGNTAKALKAIEDFKRVELTANTGIDVLQDRKAFYRAFEKKSDSLIEYPDALGKFFGYALGRDSLIGLMGSAKRGKTFWTIDMAWRAMTQRRRVIMFQVGDLSEDQMLLRLGVRAAGIPMNPCKVKFPTKITPGQPTASVSHKIYRYKKAMTRKEGWNALHSYQERLKTKESYLKLYCYPNSSVTIKQIESQVVSLADEGWFADVIVIDYPDILAPLDPKESARDQINTNWKGMRRLSQKHHCLVIAPTQADAGSYETFTLHSSNFADDRRKYDHVTGMVGINGSLEETDNGLLRLNWLFLREGRKSPIVHCAGALELCNPAIISCF